MSAAVLEKSEVLEARAIRYKSVPLTVKVVGNATPANKVLSTDLPGVAFVIAQGQTTNLPAGVTTVTPADATGLYSVVLDKESVGTVTKVLKVEVTNVTSTQTAAISLSNGYIVIDIDSAADLTAANSECIIFVDYLSR